MSVSRKYGRTWHYPFSPGTTSDDRINHHYWEDVSRIKNIVHTEKLDGENNCMSRYGVFARSHASPTVSPWSVKIREHWELIRHDLGDLEIFGENLYAIHSIEYKKLEHYFYIFGIRYLEKWLSWEETRHYAAMLDLPVVPELKMVSPLDQKRYESEILELVSRPSVLESYDTLTTKPCTCEGLVSRNVEEYAIDDFQHHVFKYVRKGHVKTDEHWTRNWKKANLIR